MATKRTQAHFDDDIFLLNGVYYYRGTPEGLKEQKEKSLKLKVGATQKEIIAAKKAYIESLFILGKKGNSKTENIFNEYVYSREIEKHNGLIDELGFGISESTFKETKTIVNLHFKPFFKNYSIGDFDQELFNEYCIYTFKKGLNLVNHRKVLNHFLKWCVKNKYLRFRVEIELENRFRRQRRKRVVVTDSNLEMLIKASNDKLTLYISMYLFMGMRNGEIRALKWSEIDLDKKALAINPANNRRRKGRVVPINDLVLRMLRNRKLETKSQFVFPQSRNNKKCMTKDGIRKTWSTALENAGLDQSITPHDLRATYEKWAHMNKDYTDTQREKMAGSKIDVQKNIYVSMDADDLRGLENAVKIKPIDALLKKRLGKQLGKTTSRKRQKDA